MVHQQQALSLLSTKLYPQWIAATGVILVLAQMGAMCGWTSPYLARLTKEESHIFLNPEEASWVASLLNVGRFIGAIIGAISVHFWGSKKALIHTLIPMSCSWFLILIADVTHASVDPATVTLPLIYTARLMGGMGLGMSFSCFPLYIGEVALPEIRGAIVTISFCGSPFGNVVASCIGPYLSLSLSSVVLATPCLLDILLFAWLPDSPHYLIKIGDLKAARKSIEWYRNGENVDEELDAVQKYVSSSSSKNFREKLDEFKKAPIRKAIFIGVMLFIYMQISGLNSVLFYMEIIFHKAKSHLIEPSLAVILVTISGAIVSAVSINLMDKCGRKILLIISGLGITISMIILGTHFMLQDLGFDSTKFQWVPLVSVFLFMISFVFGLMPVPSAVLSELFPANIKCFAACMASLAGAVFAFVATKTYQPMVNAFGEAYVFYIHAILSVTIVPFVLYFLPETKGKSLQQIQEDLISKK